MKIVLSPGANENSGTNQQIARQWIADLASGEFDKCHAAFDDTMKTAVAPEALPQIWASVADGSGEFKGIAEIREAAEAAYTVLNTLVLFEKARVVIRLVYDSEQRVAGLFVVDKQPVFDNDTVNPEVVERKVTVDAGAKCPLDGVVTRGVSAAGRTPGAVIVHGSGPVDMDGTVGANRVYRQLAEALAIQGVTALRYTKRTRAYGAQSAPDPAKLTVAEETIDDAVAAVELLRSQPDVDPERVFIIGHSLGGMLASRIAKASGNVAGVVILAGSPRKLWEIMYDQNQPGLEALRVSDKAQYEQAKQMVEAYYAAAKTVVDMDDETALKAQIFGLSAWYMRDLEKYDAADLLREINLPAFIAQGSDDFQVYADKDFAGWQSALSGCGNVVFKLYDGLNHLFMNPGADAPAKGTTAEYNIPAVIDAAVVADIARFIKR